ncbi:hypothetical protein EXN66_Car000023 [Channa argus]|uniref:C2H2-type domain-containing protein n=1 Tax=Channa argus TaxID=215402 RepID=A0A6G1QX20_CHAAH|nr:hypothetical protein EXN66_Car000023 [Channa argus]
MEDKWNRAAGPLQSSSWIKNCHEDPIQGVQRDQTDPESGASAAQIKTEAEGEDCGGSEPEFDPAEVVNSSLIILTLRTVETTGERPYWCFTCDRVFSQLSCVYKHPCQRRHLISTLVNPT